MKPWKIVAAVLRAWASEKLSDNYRLVRVAGTQSGGSLGIDVWVEAEHHEPESAWEDVNGVMKLRPAKTMKGHVVFTYYVVRFDDGTVKYLRQEVRVRFR